jgi:hypothetical protein
MKQRELARVDKVDDDAYLICVGKVDVGYFTSIELATKEKRKINREISAHVAAAIKADRANRKQVRK